MTRQRLVFSTLTATFVFAAAMTLGAQAPAAPATSEAAQPQAPAPGPRTTPPPRPPATQTTPAPATPPEPAPLPDDPDDFDDFDDFDGQDVVRIGQDFSLAAGENARSVVVVMGDAVINGHVRELVVVMGAIRLGPMARVDRELTSIAGSVTIAEGATVDREMVVIGGSVDAPAGFNPGGEHVVINPPFLGARLSAVVPYFTQGLMWGRVIVPSLWWLWGIVGVFFIVYLVVNLLGDAPVLATALVVQDRGLTAFGTGLLVLLLVGPICFLLAISVVGILVIPVLLCAMLAAALVGKVAIFRWLGMHVWRTDQRGSMEAAGTFAIGFAIVTLIYMVPILGAVAFALLSVLGLGAATLAFVAAYKREQPPVPPAPVAPPPPVLPPTPPIESAGSPGGEVPVIPMTAAPPLAAPGAYEASVLPRGAFRDRLAAFVLDIILVVLVVQVAWPFRGSRIFFLALLAYHIGFWAWKNTTVGGIICQLRIVRVDGVPLSVADALIRGLSAIFSLVVLGLGFFWVLRDPERQSWHDKIAGTYVVKVPRNWRH